MRGNHYTPIATPETGPPPLAPVWREARGGVNAAPVRSGPLAFQSYSGGRTMALSQYATYGAHPVQFWFALALVGSTGLFWVAVGAYVVKSALGIDLFDGPSFMHALVY